MISHSVSQFKQDSSQDFVCAKVIHLKEMRYKNLIFLLLVTNIILFRRNLNFNLACLLSLTALTLKVNGDEISCSLFDKQTTSARRCHFNSSAVISSSDTSIADVKDNTVDAVFIINYNLKVKFLPVNVHAKFPNVKSIQAVGCSIKEISKKNFASLDQLKSIVLNSNEITKVPSDTFQGLTQLMVINLGKKLILLS